MATLQLHGVGITTVFDLLGKTENDMTYSLGWCMSQVPSFLDSIGALLGTPELSEKKATISLQEHHAGTGITDIEIHAPGHIRWIIEAKRGFTVPSTDQLRRYAQRLHEKRGEDKAAIPGLAVLAESDRKNQWLQRQLPAKVLDIPVRSVSWREVQQAAKRAASDASQAGKRLLAQFASYLGTVGNMQDQHSNRVYVVSLGHKTFGGETTFIEVVEKHLKYFHPVGGGRGGWPTEPPNYIAFRYDGALQSIHHIEDYEVITDFGPLFPNQPSEEIDPHFLYQLGPPIRPTKRTPTGPNWRNARVWCFIDTLLTSESVVAAKAATDERLRRTGE